MPDDDRFDAVIVGSGFGGAVTAARLAESGYSVLVLERGRRWDPKHYPRSEKDHWLWDHHNPRKRNGWIDLRTFRGMAVAQGAAVGGGSLIYANISVDADPSVFDQGWPDEITHQKLQPFYRTVADVMDVQQIPTNQLPERTRIMREAAEAIGESDRFRLLDLAVTFDPEWHYELEDARNEKHSKTFVNRWGAQQGTCVHLGNCVLGCEVRAKNTLELNYLQIAENHKAVVRPLHLVHYLEPEEDGYRVHFEDLNEDGGRGSVHARLCIVAAGSLGSTELLLRCRDEKRTLTDVSQQLGLGWSSNGDFMTPAHHPNRDVNPTQGPTITSAIDFRDGGFNDQSIFVEDGGFPDLGENWLQDLRRRRRLGRLNPFARIERWVLSFLLQLPNPTRHLMPWFAQGVDAGDGVLTLRRRWLGLAGKRYLSLRWELKPSRRLFDSIVELHGKLARSLGGDPDPPITWEVAHYLVTPHPLGGCRMGRDADHGVVDHRGKVFGYDNLYVLDGSIIPRPIGANPSKTIAALAERASELIIREGP